MTHLASGIGQMIQDAPDPEAEAKSIMRLAAMSLIYLTSAHNAADFAYQLADEMADATRAEVRPI